MSNPTPASHFLPFNVSHLSSSRRFQKEQDALTGTRRDNQTEEIFHWLRSSVFLKKYWYDIIQYRNSFLKSPKWKWLEWINSLGVQEYYHIIILIQTNVLFQLYSSGSVLFQAFILLTKSPMKSFSWNFKYKVDLLWRKQGRVGGRMEVGDSGGRRVPLAQPALHLHPPGVPNPDGPPNSIMMHATVAKKIKHCKSIFLLYSQK